MAPVIWGLDLGEVHWSKFNSRYMWNNEYHLRRTQFVVYQCVLIFCVVSESLGTSAMDDYLHSQQKVKKLDSNVYVYNNDFVGAASFNIFASVFVSIIFGAAFFFDLFWPERHESKSIMIAWKACGVLSCIFYLANALWLTVVSARNCGYFRGASYEYGQSLLPNLTKDGGTPLCYKHNPRIVASVVFVWLGFVSVVPSCILLFLSIHRFEKGPGPKSTHTRERDDAERVAEAGMSSDPEKEDERDSAAPNQQQSSDGAALDVPEAESTPIRGRPNSPPNQPSIHLSSTWNDVEQIMFPLYLSTFGHNFSAIATQMGTKTAAEVEEHYNELAGAGEEVIKKKLMQSHAVTDDRLHRRESAVGPSTPPLAPRRRTLDISEQPTSHKMTPISDTLSNSDMTGSSTFSSYARPERFSFHETPVSKRARQPQDSRGVTLGERSLASLTSGIADNGHVTR